jgi:hypothetical protein
MRAGRVVDHPGLESGGYWHNAYGRMRLAPDDPARDAASAARLFDTCEDLVRGAAD